MLLVLSTMLGALFLIMYSEEKGEKNLRYLKMCIGGFVVSLTLLVFVPTKETLIQMLVAQYVTENNLNYVVNISKQIIEGIK